MKKVKTNKRRCQFCGLGFAPKGLPGHERACGRSVGSAAPPMEPTDDHRILLVTNGKGVMAVYRFSGKGKFEPVKWDEVKVG